MNYDPTPFRGSGDHLSLHVQLYVLADKYDMAPLRKLSLGKFRRSLAETLPSTDDLANAAMCAYEAEGATTEIRKDIVGLAVKQNFISTDITSGPANGLERAMEQYPRLCVDIAKVQQSMIQRQLISLESEVREMANKSESPQSKCPSCKVGHIFHQPSGNTNWLCGNCERRFT